MRNNYSYQNMPDFFKSIIKTMRHVLQLLIILFSRLIIDLVLDILINIIKAATMNQQNNSLIGYLKKKSLFSESPSKYLQSRQRSKQKRSIGKQIRSPRGMNNIYQKSSRQSEQNIHQESSFRNYQQQVQSDIGYNSMQVQRPSRFNNSFQVQQNSQKQQLFKRNFQLTSPQNTKSVVVTKEEENTNLWTGLVNYANSFQSARIQSAQCLQTMSIKLQAELSNINYKVDIFHTKLVQMLNKQFMTAKQKIYAIVNKVFEECEQNMRSYIKYQEETLARELLQMKEILSKEYQKVQLMKQQINKPSWRKVAGELLSTELEQKIEGHLNRSRNIDIQNLEVGDLGIGKISSLENILRDMIKLSTR